MKVEAKASWNLPVPMVWIILNTDKINKSIKERFPQANLEQIKDRYISESAPLLEICNSCPLRRKEKRERRNWFFIKISLGGICGGFKRGSASYNYISADWDRSELSKLSLGQIREKMQEASCKPDTASLV